MTGEWNVVREPRPASTVLSVEVSPVLAGRVFAEAERRGVTPNDVIRDLIALMPGPGNPGMADQYEQAVDPDPAASPPDGGEAVRWNGDWPHDVDDLRPRRRRS